jgi:hypothetical protein
MAQASMHLHYAGPAGDIYVPAACLVAQAGDDLLRGLETLLFLSWDPAAPGPWFARLASFPLAGGAFFVTWERDGQPAQLVARVAPAATRRSLWPIFLRDFLAHPDAYHTEPLDPAAFPERITNYRPDLFPESLLRAALQPLNLPPGHFESAYEEESS